MRPFKANSFVLAKRSSMGLIIQAAHRFKLRKHQEERFLWHCVCSNTEVVNNYPVYMTVIGSLIGKLSTFLPHVTIMTSDLSLLSKTFNVTVRLERAKFQDRDVPQNYIFFVILSIYIVICTQIYSYTYFKYCRNRRLSKYSFINLTEVRSMSESRIFQHRGRIHNGNDMPTVVDDVVESRCLCYTVSHCQLLIGFLPKTLRF